MRVFISSVEDGYQHYRAAVQRAVETLGHQVIRAEEMPTSAQTPQQGCLAGVRRADVVLLLMGGEYGAVQQSGLSATHEEYREARDTRPVLVFVESGVVRGPMQQAFLAEVEAWATGHFRTAYGDADQLLERVLRALHEHELAVAAGPVDEESLVARAHDVLRTPVRISGGPSVVVAAAFGPYRQVLRPVELDMGALDLDVQREAMFGPHAVLDRYASTSVEREGALVVRQQAAAVLVNQVGDMQIVQPARRTSTRGAAELPAVIEEKVAATLVTGLRFAGWLAERVDPLRRLSDVAVLASVTDAGFMPWRTCEEHAANPHSSPVVHRTSDPVVTLTPARRHRQSLGHDAERMAEDLTVLLRRELRG
jgi:Domain of unknown function (DUF4062)